MNDIISINRQFLIMAREASKANDSKACKAAELSVNHRVFWKFDELKSEQFSIQEGKVRFKPGVILNSSGSDH